jgi:hypothetical protein
MGSRKYDTSLFFAARQREWWNEGGSAGTVASFGWDIPLWHVRKTNNKAVDQNCFEQLIVIAQRV